MQAIKEVAFEDAIVEHLVTHVGYTRGVPTNFDPAVALDTAELFTIIGATQADEWEGLVKRNGDDPDLAQRRFVDRLANRSTSAGRSTSSVTVKTSASTSGSRTSGRRPGLSPDLEAKVQRQPAHGDPATSAARDRIPYG